jgi:hypothetical protein
MQKISYAQFRKAVVMDPAWASTLKEPVEITEFANMDHSGIWNLSPLLHFTGRNSAGEVASFEKCENLKVAEGNFHGFVNFEGAAIEKIGKLKILKPDNHGEAASFRQCVQLKIAEGIYPGHVIFQESGIQKIGNLIVKGFNDFGESANLSQCPELKEACGTFAGFVTFSESGIETIGDLKAGRMNTDGISAQFLYCDKLKEAAGTFAGAVVFYGSSIERIDPKRLIITGTDGEGIAANFVQCEKLKKIEGTFPGLVLCNHSDIEEFGELSIEDPKQNRYIAVAGSSMKTKTIKALAQSIFQKKSTEELKIIHDHTPVSEPDLKSAVHTMIQTMETIRRKNAAVEIQID